MNLPEGLEAIPESCFGSTTLDVLVIPESVTSIGDYATYGAACIVIQNPNVEIGTNAIQADYIFLQNAGDYVFPSDHCAMMGSCLYLDSIYDPAEIQGDFYSATSMSYQIYLPSDATMEQEAKSASPQRRYPFGFVASGTRLTPTSITTAPGLSMSPVSVLGRPAATTTTSA